MGKKLYVGNLSYEMYDNDLKTLFEQAGEVDKVTIIFDNATGRSKGFAFVEMATEEGAQKAIETMNGQEVKGRKMIVNEARPQEPRKPGMGGGRRPFGGGGGGGGRSRY